MPGLRVYSYLTKSVFCEIGLAVALGGVIYFIVLQVVIWLGVDTNLLKLFQALVVAVFLAVPYWKSRYFTKSKKIEETAKEGR